MAGGSPWPGIWRPERSGIAPSALVGGKGFEPLASSASKSQGQCLDQHRCCSTPVSIVTPVTSSTVRFGRLLDQELTALSVPRCPRRTAPAVCPPLTGGKNRGRKAPSARTAKPARCTLPGSRDLATKSRRERSLAAPPAPEALGEGRPELVALLHLVLQGVELPPELLARPASWPLTHNLRPLRRGDTNPSLCLH